MNTRKYRLRPGATVQGHPTWLRHDVTYDGVVEPPTRPGDLPQVRLCEPNGADVTWVTEDVLDDVTDPPQRWPSPQPTTPC